MKVSFELPDYTAQVDGLGTLRFLDAIREVGIGKQTKFYQASTSELYGKVQEVPQTETTPFYPRSPYGVAKLYGYWIIVNYREAYDLFACNGILFNHESPRRGETFVTRKITRSANKILFGIDNKLILGNLDAKRDWGYAPEYCEGMWKILQHGNPEDFVLATGETHTVREFTELTFKELGIELEWFGKGDQEKGIVTLINNEKLFEFISRIYPDNADEILKKTENTKLKPGAEVVEVSPGYYRPTEVELLVGDFTKAKEKLNWEPKTKFDSLISIMTEADFRFTLKRGY